MYSVYLKCLFVILLVSTVAFAQEGEYYEGKVKSFASSLLGGLQKNIDNIDVKSGNLFSPKAVLDIMSNFVELAKKNLNDFEEEMKSDTAGKGLQWPNFGFPKM